MEGEEKGSGEKRKEDGELEEEHKAHNYRPRQTSELGLSDSQDLWPDVTWRTPRSFTCRGLRAALGLATSCRAIDVHSGSGCRHSNKPDRRA